MRTSIKTTCLIFLLLCFLSYFSRAQSGSRDKGRGLGKVSRSSSSSWFTINRLTNIYYNNGEGSLSPFYDGGTLVFPKGSGKVASYEDGLLIGGKRLGRLFMDGSTYGSGMQPGRILVPGTGADRADAQADDPNLPEYRIYRVRPDINPNTALRDRAIQQLSVDEVPFIAIDPPPTAGSLYDQYAKDWTEWPAGLGAPYEDVDQNGVYDPSIDIPGIPGADQTLWHVFNDMDSAKCVRFYSALPVGIEIQRTIWGYNQQGPLGNVVFLRYKIVNKSGAPLDSCYLAMFADVDLGDGWNDLAGCDTTLDVGYVYNGSPVDAVYGDEPPPAVGYVYFSGPTVEANLNDSAIVDLTRAYGKLNQRMSSFAILIGGGPALFADPPMGFTGNITGAAKWYNYMKGRTASSGQPWVGPRGDTTTFVCSGDPVEGTGWVDGVYPYPPADRRIAANVGPFTIKTGETQECVLGLIVAEGSDYLGSITKMKEVAKGAHDLYDNLALACKPPPPPSVTKSELDGKVILSWGDPESVNRTESLVSRDYTFKGYVVSQLKSTIPGSDDVVIARFRSPLGLKRSILITRDTLRQMNLVNGSNYYFGVSAWSHNPSPLGGEPPDLFGAATVIEVVPQREAFGIEHLTTYGGIVTTTKIGIADGKVVVKIALPTAVQSGTYMLDFDSTGRYSIYRNAVLLDRLSTSPAKPNIIVGGMDWSVTGFSYEAPTDIRSSDVSFHRRYDSQLSWLGTGKYFGGSSGFYKSLTTLPVGNIPATKVQWDLQLRFTGVPSYYTAHSTDTVIISGGQIATLWPRDALGLGDVTAFTPSLVRGPFELWDTENNVQINYCVVDGNADSLSPWGSSDGSFRAFAKQKWVRWPGGAYIVVNYSPYNAARQTSPVDSNATFLLYYDPTKPWKPSDTVSIHIDNSVVAGADKYVFTLKADTSSPEIEKEQVRQINVYPNPFFAYSQLRPNRFNPYVTISHLPQKASIRIFNILGHLVKSYAKDSPTQFMTWDLKNELGRVVSSGIYVVHIDMPTLGLTKVLKLAVIAPL